MSSQLARVQDTDPQSWDMMVQQAHMLVKTGFLQESVNTPEKALHIMLKGRELGLPPMASLSGITVIKNKAVCSAELMAAIIYRDHGDDALRVVVSDAATCTIRYKRRGWKDYSEQSFTIEDAKRAQLMSNNTWIKFPVSMLKARCISSIARVAFPDSIGGMYVPEEVGARYVVDDDSGEMTVAETPSPKADTSAVGMTHEAEIVAPTTDLPAGEWVGNCDVTHFRKRYFAIVKGTYLATDEGRHALMAKISGGGIDSLDTYLATLDEAGANYFCGEVEALCATVFRPLAEYDTAIGKANDLGVPAPNGNPWPDILASKFAGALPVGPKSRVEAATIIQKGLDAVNRQMARYDEAMAKHDADAAAEHAASAQAPAERAPLFGDDTPAGPPPAQPSDAHNPTPQEATNAAVGAVRANRAAEEESDTAGEELFEQGDAVDIGTAPKHIQQVVEELAKAGLPTAGILTNAVFVEKVVNPELVKRKRPAVEKLTDLDATTATLVCAAIIGKRVAPAMLGVNVEQFTD